MKRTTTKTPSMPTLKPTLQLTAALTLSVWLAGCAVTSERPPAGEHSAPVPAHYAGWFSSGPEANTDGSDWQTINLAQERIEEGRLDEAIAYLRPLMARYVPPAFYEMAKLYEQGLGVEQDYTEAARLYGEAINKPSSTRGHASLNLARLYREGRGVERNDVLAYHLLWQAKEANLDRTAESELANLLSKGGEDVEADPQLARQLYEQAASQGNEQALLALAQAYAPDGWLKEDATQSMSYAQRYATRLETSASQGDVGAMLQLASLYSPEGLLGDRSDQRIQWLQQAAQLGDQEAQARAGQALINAGEYRLGISVLEKPARRGNVEAMTYLGQALLAPENDVYPQASSDAERWLSRAIEADSNDARLILGRALIEGRAGLDDLPRGIDLLEHAARNGDSLALAQLGALLMDDARVERQPAIAADYLKRGHELGHPWATQQLGAAYLEGRGVARDPTQGQQLLLEAAEQGQTGALRLLGEAYLSGEALPLQPERGQALLTQAAQAGDITAMTILGEAYLNGSLEGDSSQGIRLISQAAEQGDGYAMVLLGRAYREGNGVTRDLYEARRWLTQAQAAGHSSAASALVYVQRDLGAEGDIDALIAAAQDGHPSAMANLGRAYLDGEGVNRDQAQAEHWLEQAYQADHAGAGALLGRLYLDRGESERGLAYLETAVSRGHAGARQDLGEAYLTGSQPNRM
ncbi:tetratricopeptide repeat protein [Vreelandella aquamarina]|uniref:tetratricopeptide repeat protein n=1 Tax=Vreelandella aquamarina TaxID=77097 RepID=UPI001CC5FE1D|nr:tetratricopeptide repeat protein [Halomonas aquamarina]